MEERLLRFASPTLYQKMIEAFSTYHLHPYDVYGTLTKKGDVMVVTLRFSADYTQEETIFLQESQLTYPDEAVEQFFLKVAEKCKSLLVTDYFNMTKG
ncbi:hypothetical protein ACE38V_08610 [Cytobacillus sp. Hz8]|uniref:hypothetical protein n=1 Tax=Cytobacillus sp. Hz8 TaxID=3347168 RepID=UPI0035D6BA8A